MVETAYKSSYKKTQNDDVYDFVNTIKDEIDSDIKYKKNTKSENINVGGISKAFINDPIKMYLKSIGKVRLLTASEEINLAKRIENKDSSAKNKLIESNLRLVVSVAKIYVLRGCIF